jgi:DNA-binding response OmpR family regulator
MKKILVIDDDDLFGSMLKRMLDKAGYQVELAVDGIQGIKMFSVFEPDLVITDIIMPEKEGIEVIMELRKLSPDVKIIAVSGGGRRMPGLSILPIAKRLGAIHTFSKPVDRPELLAAIEELFAGHKGSL